MFIFTPKLFQAGEIFKEFLENKQSFSLLKLLLFINVLVDLLPSVHNLTNNKLFKDHNFSEHCTVSLPTTLV